jgi:hypothetical protein
MRRIAALARRRPARDAATGLLSGPPDVPEGDDQQLDDYVADAPVTLQYSAPLPPETFDLVIVEEGDVDVDPYRIRTGIGEQGSTIDAGTIVPTVDRRTLCSGWRPSTTTSPTRPASSTTAR